MSKFTPASLPDLTDFVVIVTGGHSGLGLATTKELARHGASVYIASRSPLKVEQAIQGIRQEQPEAKLHFLQMDLGDLRSVKKAAEDFISKETSLHILLNNAGVMCTPYGLSPQYQETQFQTNYLSHFYLTSLLLSVLQATAVLPSTRSGSVRIVNVSSSGHAKLAPKSGIPFDDMQMASLGPWTIYGVSKLANVLHAKELARRYSGMGVKAVSLHPGTVKTSLSAGPRETSWWYKYMQPLVELGAPAPERGCWGILWCAASAECGEADNGAYFQRVGKNTGASVCAEDKVMAGKLWAWSEAVLKEGGF